MLDYPRTRKLLEDGETQARLVRKRIGVQGPSSYRGGSVKGEDVADESCQEGRVVTRSSSSVTEETGTEKPDRGLEICRLGHSEKSPIPAKPETE